MIIHIDKKNILKIKNSYFFADALKYVKIYENLLEQLRERNLEIDTQNFEEEHIEKIETLKKKGAILRNSNNST